ncbi:MULTISPECIES: DUF7848 domain-containing protein [Streptomyces]|uniref:DUF7848 domain-containing protein n=2 Tax=Streptomyces TaxID=1883 RepID=A0A1I6W0A6_9ACTN|nr:MULTISPECIES: hypothetical protein [Streptomyces]SFT19379.1 hypothetical protein SAMN05444716_11185 [Streptomyces harbinensis]
MGLGMWFGRRDRRADAAPMSHRMRCDLCRKKSEPSVDFGQVQDWQLDHAARYPGHRQYTETLTRPWRTERSGTGLEIEVMTVQGDGWYRTGECTLCGRSGVAVSWIGSARAAARFAHLFGCGECVAALRERVARGPGSRVHGTG